jgi:tRNA A37 threonylcarbamoyladenosine dehydratase
MSTDQRFNRTVQLLGRQRFESLTQARVAVVGIGAVGGFAVEALARAGIGELIVVDFDTVQLTNINRQIGALESTIGMKKTEVARLRILDINPHCKITSLDVFVDENNTAMILGTKPDIVVDAIDGLGPKVKLLTAIHNAGITCFSSMGAALRTDPRRIEVDDISRTRGCPLARRLRSRLKRSGVTTGITCVYSTEPIPVEHEPEGAESKSSALMRGRNRAPLGSLPTLTAIFGLILANEVLLHICRQQP